MKKIVGLFLAMMLAFNRITVTYAEPPYIENVKINAGETITMYVGDEITLEAEAEPEGWSHAYMVWDSDAEDVVIVNSDDGSTAFEPPVSSATIRALKEGTAVVTVYANLWIYPSKEWSEHDSVTINVIPDCSLGDANGDSAIDVKDVISVRQHLAEGYDVTVFEPLADVNKDNTLDVRDIVLLRRYIAGGYGIELK